MIIAALREEQPMLGEPTARRRAELIVERLRQAGYDLAPLPVGWPRDGDR